MNNKEIKKNLKSEKTSLILETLKFIAQEGNKEIMYDVIELLDVTSETIIRDEIIKIIENLRDQECVPSIIKAIENKDYANILSILVSSSWKNSLDFSAYADIFTEVFIKSEFQLAFDAFTVIDNFKFISSYMADSCLLRLENAIEDIKDDKKVLYFELINIIRNKKENPAD